MSESQFAVGRDGPTLLIHGPMLSTTPLANSQRRRRDAVVDAARTLDDLSPGGVEEFVRRRWRGVRKLKQSDINAFAADARVQRIHDVVDALDYRVRRGVLGRAGSRVGRVELPRGLARKTLASLSDGEVEVVRQRLRERGWSAEQIKRHVRRVDPDGRLREVSADAAV